MSVIPVDLGPKSVTNSISKRRSFRRGLAQALDVLVAYPTKHALSEYELCRIDQDIKRYQGLMHKDFPPVGARLDRAARHRGARAIQAR